MPYITDDIECASINPGNSTEPSAFCQYLKEGQEAYLCETNTERPYFILLEAGEGEEIIVFHTERFIDAMTQQAGIPQRQKTDFALISVSIVQQARKVEKSSKTRTFTTE